MKKMVPVLVIGAALAGFVAGQALRPKAEGVLSGHFDELSMMPNAIAQEKGEVMLFGYNSPREPALAPDAPPTTYWNIDDVRKAHTELAEKAARALTQAGRRCDRGLRACSAGISMNFRWCLARLPRRRAK